MYSTNNEEKSVIAERFIRTLKNKIFKHMTSISKNVYIDKLDDTVKEYNNTNHKSIKRKPVDVKDNITQKFQNTRIFLLKGICQIGLNKFLLLVKLKILYHKQMFLMTLTVKKLLVLFMKMNCKRLIKKNSE